MSLLENPCANVVALDAIGLVKKCLVFFYRPYVGVRKLTVYKYLSEHYSLSTTRHEIVSASSLDLVEKRELIKLDFEETGSYAETGRRFKLSRQRIHQIVRGYKNYGLSGREKLYNLAWKDTCEICHKNPTQELHHVNKNNLDDRAENLLPVCIPCHKELHLSDLGKKRRTYILKSYSKKKKNKKCDLCKGEYHAKGLCYPCYIAVWNWNRRKRGII